MKMPRAYIYGVRAQSVASGIDQIANQMASLPDTKVQVYNWTNWPDMLTDVNLHAEERALRLAFAYNFGANALTWVLGGVTDSGVHVEGCRCKFDFAVFIDPSKRSSITPLAPDKLAAGLHYKNIAFDLVGHAFILAPGVPLEVIPVHGSHIILEKDPLVQRAIIDQFKEVMKQ